jgi:hypothetical protein
VRVIEIKGRVTGAATVTLTRNEVLASLNKRDDFILAIVEFVADGTHRVHYVRRPFHREPDKVTAEIEARLKADLHARGGFDRVHVAPQSGADVSDEMEARLVVLGPEQPHTKEASSKAEVQAKVILQSRGSALRLFQNTLVFLAADLGRLQDLDEAVRRALAWRSVVSESQTLDLSPHQVKQAEIREKAADAIVDMRLPEAYQWLLVPVQPKPGEPIGWDALRLSGQDHLAEWALKKLKSGEALITVLAGTNLRLELDKIPLWRGDHVAVKQLCEDFARYVCLPRLASPDVLAVAIHDGLSWLLWMNETFAWADSHDDAAGRYRGLRCGQAPAMIKASSAGLLVKPEAALRQQEALEGPRTLAFRRTEAKAREAPKHPRRVTRANPGLSSGSDGIDRYLILRRIKWCARRDSNARPSDPESDALSGLSYGHTREWQKKWGGRRDLNPRPSEPQSDALPV